MDNKMTHATITPNTAILCNVAFDYDYATKETILALTGAAFDGHNWIVPILHLPILKLIFSSMTVAPEVVTAYHELLKRMLCDFAGSEHRKGALGQHVTELQQRHAIGIAAVRKTGWEPTPRPRATVAPAPLPQSEPAPASEDRALALLLSGIKNAHVGTEKAGYIAHAAKRKRKQAA